MKKSTSMKKGEVQEKKDAQNGKDNGTEPVLQKKGKSEQPNNAVKPKMKTNTQQNEQGNNNAEK